MPGVLSKSRSADCPALADFGDSAAFDLPALVHRCMDDRSLAATLLETFTLRLGMSLAEIQRLVDLRDWSAAAFKVHELKGEAGSMAAVRLHAAAAKLDACLRGARHADVALYLAALLREAAHCLDAAPVALQQLGSDLAQPS